jgi:hypothetical protein
MLIMENVDIETMITINDFFELIKKSYKNKNILYTI